MPMQLRTRGRNLSVEAVTTTVNTTNPAAKKSKRLPSVSVATTTAATAQSVATSKVSGKYFLGAHVSAAGGLHNAFANARDIDADAFALFIKPRTWKYAPLSDDIVNNFKAAMAYGGIKPEHILPHAQYIVNLGSAEVELRQKSFDYFLDDLRRCERLGLQLYNFHPGSGGSKCTKEECIANIIDCLNRALAETSTVTAVLENMAGQGSHVGATFQELATIINGVEQKFRDGGRIGVCLDTCHSFAAGYDIRTAQGFDAVLNEFDDVVGLKYLRAIHVNDSKAELGAHVDRHENLGKGHIGLDAFKFMMQDSRLHDIPLILETPVKDDNFEIWKREIKLLRSYES